MNTGIDATIPDASKMKAVASCEMLNDWLRFTLGSGIGSGAFNSSSLSFFSNPVSWSHMISGLRMSCQHRKAAAFGFLKQALELTSKELPLGNT